MCEVNVVLDPLTYYRQGYLFTNTQNGHFKLLIDMESFAYHLNSC